MISWCSWESSSRRAVSIVSFSTITATLELIDRTHGNTAVTAIGTVILPLPATLAGGISGSTTVGGAVYAAELVVMAAVAIPVLYLQWRRRAETSVVSEDSSRVMFGYAAAYLVVMAALWAAALPAYLGADGGVTAAGDPIGSLWYTVVCFVIAGLSLAAAWSTGSRRERMPENQDRTVTSPRV